MRSHSRVDTRPPLHILRVDAFDLLQPREPIPLVPAERASGVSVVVLDGDAVDWDNIAPHPRLAELAAMCAACGFALGEHDAAAPYACGDARCDGYRAPSPALLALTKDGAP